ncbi:hypothetical protein CDEST_02002 [Colletotrichum destructivum]|uniref:Rhodopsin domain-containing protein n=1 Tax=Colletotrichum destructivum TaxID=34406 RepID=A0AAX4I1X5_9PEZI|nr:hypothetical protein CDEST_02002 [Colletotrichum destructivum]
MDLQPSLLSAIYLSFSLGGAINILTMSVRLAIGFFKKRYEWDDYLMLPACVCSLGAQVILIVMIPSGLSYWQLSDVVELLILLSHSLTKLSLVGLYLRTFPFGWPRRIQWAMFAAISAYTITIAGLLAHRASVSTSVTPTSINELNFDALLLPIAATGAGIITDLSLIILAITTILGLRANPKLQLKPILAFSSPIIATTSSSVRLYFLFDLPGSVDTAKTAATAILILFIEANLTIVCGNFPAIIELTRRIKDKTSGWINTATSRNRGSVSDRWEEGSSHEMKGPEASGDASSQRGILTSGSLDV